MRLTKVEKKKVESVTVEESDFGLMFGRNIQYWVELNRGFCFEDRGRHCFGEDTQKLVKESLLRVRPYHCNDCEEN